MIINLLLDRRWDQLAQPAAHGVADEPADDRRGLRDQEVLILDLQDFLILDV